MLERRLGHLVSGHEILGDEAMVKPEEIERRRRPCGFDFHHPLQTSRL
jgi:hypothetical protein